MKTVNPGDILRLGRHVVACGDSFDTDFRSRVLEAAGASRVDAVVTDPPYAIYGSSTGVDSDVADDNMVRPFFRQLVSLLAADLAHNGHAYVFCDWRTLGALQDGAKSARLPVKNVIVWDKMRPGLGTHWMNQHELVAFLVNQPPRKGTKGRREGGAGRTVSRANVVRCGRVDPGARNHNANKPVALLEGFIRASTHEGAVVADYFLGGGSTVLACESTRRRCVGIEVDPRTVESAVQRIEKALGVKATQGAA